MKQLIHADTKIDNLTNEGGGSSSWNWDVSGEHFMLTLFQNRWSLKVSNPHEEILSFKSNAKSENTVALLKALQFSINYRQAK